MAGKRRLLAIDDEMHNLSDLIQERLNERSKKTYFILIHSCIRVLRLCISSSMASNLRSLAM
jgi:hypothetical protein